MIAERTKVQPWQSHQYVSNLVSVLEDVYFENEWKRHGKTQTVLYKDASMTVVLVALREGAIFNHRKTEASFTLQVLDGEIELDTNTRKMDLERGDVILMEGKTESRIKAMTDCGLLITLASSELFLQALHGPPKA